MEFQSHFCSIINRCGLKISHLFEQITICNDTMLWIIIYSPEFNISFVYFYFFFHRLRYHNAATTPWHAHYFLFNSNIIIFCSWFSFLKCQIESKIGTTVFSCHVTRLLKKKCNNNNSVPVPSPYDNIRVIQYYYITPYYKSVG